MSKEVLFIYLGCVIGIVISIVLPILRALLPRPPVAAAAPPKFMAALWKYAKPYLVVGVFSLLTAFLIIALTGDTVNGFKGGLLAGYLWDSTLQKLGKP
jgi:uncharacterized oligopeptide transporter (OPT) family protein